MKDNDNSNPGPLDPFKAKSPVYLNREKISLIDSKITGKIGEDTQFKIKEFYPKYGEKKHSDEAFH